MADYFKEREKQFAVDELNEEADFPKNALIELTNACNHKCIFCKNSNQIRRTTKIDFEVYKKFITEAVSLGLEEVGLYATGEPFMTDNLHDFIFYAKDNGVRRVYLSTNGSLATLERVQQCYEAGLDSIKYSINAGNTSDYFAVHRFNDFEKVLKNVKDVHNWVSKNNLSLQMLGSCVSIPAFPDTHEQYKAIFGDLFEDTDYVVSTSQGGQMYDLRETESHLSPVFNEQVFSHNVKAETKPCGMLWNRYHVTAEGYLTTCCVDYDLNLVFGSMNKGKLADLWNCETIRNLRRKHISSDLKGTICDQCLNNRRADYDPLMLVEMKLKKKSQIDKESAALSKRFSDLKVINIAEDVII